MRHLLDLRRQRGAPLGREDEMLPEIVHIDEGPGRHGP
jgi:hypothetical protein